MATVEKNARITLVIWVLSITCATIATLVIGAENAAKPKSPEDASKPSLDVPQASGVGGVTSEEQWNGRRMQNDSAALSVMVPAVTTADKVWLDAVMANSGSGTFTIGATGYFLDCKPSLKDEAGRDVPYSRFGWNLFVETSHTQYWINTYRAGDSHAWHFNAASAFEPLKKGTYYLTVECRIIYLGSQGNADKTVTLIARNLPLTITD